MMNNRQTELAKRLAMAACKRCRPFWRSGMVMIRDPHDAAEEWRAVEIGDTCEVWISMELDVYNVEHEDDDDLPVALLLAVRAGEGYPDLSDPATVGCLLAMLWEAWPNAVVERWIDITDNDRPYYTVDDDMHGRLTGKCDTPEEAIASAMLHAWAVSP